MIIFLHYDLNFNLHIYNFNDVYIMLIIIIFNYYIITFFIYKTINKNILIEINFYKILFTMNGLHY